jgi:hypothetical protein
MCGPIALKNVAGNIDLMIVFGSIVVNTPKLGRSGVSIKRMIERYQKVF